MEITSFCIKVLNFANQNLSNLSDTLKIDSIFLKWGNVPSNQYLK